MNDGKEGAPYRLPDFQLDFPHMINECDVLISKKYRPMDTRRRYQLKLPGLHISFLTNIITVSIVLQ
jgi:hypothetical protein